MFCDLFVYGFYCLSEVAKWEKRSLLFVFLGTDNLVHVRFDIDFTQEWFKDNLHKYKHRFNNNHILEILKTYSVLPVFNGKFVCQGLAYFSWH